MELLERLRKFQRLRGDTYSCEEAIGMIGQAADEIERLTVLAGEKECPKCGGSGWIINMQTLSPSDDEPCNYCRSR